MMHTKRKKGKFKRFRGHAVENVVRRFFSKFKKTGG